MSKKKSKSAKNTIVVNKKARHDFFIEDDYEAGIALEGWEVKSLRAGRVQIKEGYILLQNNEAYLFGANISPLPAASTHVKADPTRNRKLLLHRRELDKLIGNVERKGYTVVPLAMYWSKGRVKLGIGLAKGKQSHDKRQSEKQRDWAKEKQRLLKHH